MAAPHPTVDEVRIALPGRTRVWAPLAEVWPLLRNAAAVAGRIIPGAQPAPDRGDEDRRGSVRVRFGPTAAIFRGEATLGFDHAALGFGRRRAVFVPTPAPGR